MTKKKRHGAKGALLDEYERALLELQHLIADFSDNELTVIVDSHTKDEDCRSVQSVLAHVVRSGNAYAIFIHNQKGHRKEIPERKIRFSVKEYIQDLNQLFEFTEAVFQDIEDEELEQPDDSKKIKVSWGQLYDIEQLMEHAIVHILRHRRQLEKFKYHLGV